MKVSKKLSLTYIPVPHATIDINDVTNRSCSDLGEQPNATTNPGENEISSHAPQSSEIPGSPFIQTTLSKGTIRFPNGAYFLMNRIEIIICNAFISVCNDTNLGGIAMSDTVSENGDLTTLPCPGSCDMPNTCIRSDATVTQQSSK